MSENLEKYKSSFVDALEIKSDVVNDTLEYNSVSEWDSIGHMSLISKIEENFDISFETDDIIDFSSFNKGIEILKSNYKIEI